jgi:NADP-dependent 3-hydroxy acid dehydrogenase YdfG
MMGTKGAAVRRAGHRRAPGSVDVMSAKVAIVAGAAGARGHAMAAVLAAAGRTVVAAGRSEQALRDLT